VRARRTRTRAPPCGSGGPQRRCRGAPWAALRPRAAIRRRAAGDRATAEPAGEVGGAAPETDGHVETAVERQIRARAGVSRAEAHDGSGGVFHPHAERQRPPVDRGAQIGARHRHSTGVLEASLEAAERGFESRGASGLPTARLASHNAAASIAPLTGTPSC
jgi:hypothetical protein